MGWWIYLEDHDAEPWCSYNTPESEFVPEFEGDTICSEPCYPTVEVESHEEGGTYVLGGTGEAEVSVTWNYGKFFGFRSLDGMKAAESVSTLEEAVEHLGTERDPDYWAPTPGNAGAVCALLLSWARQHPQAIWRVS